MKTHFLRLFDYDRYTNLLLLQCILEMNAPVKPVQLMAHLLAAQNFWLNRCKNLHPPDFALWPDWKTEIFESIIHKNHQDLSEFINHSSAEDFDQTINYQNTKGESFGTSLSDILIHIINHGTHHRAQIGQQLKLAGLQQLPATDYIFYLRNKNL